VTAQEEGTEAGGGGGGTVPDYGDWFDDVDNFSGPGDTVDATGQDTVTVEVGVQANGGAFGFGPPAVQVDNGATVQWEWTGEGGGHNVVSDGGGPLDSGEPVANAGVNYEFTFDEDGIFNYYCDPHLGLGMKGSVVGGEEFRGRRRAGRGRPTRSGRSDSAPLRRLRGRARGHHPAHLHLLPAQIRRVPAHERRQRLIRVVVSAGPVFWCPRRCTL